MKVIVIIATVLLFLLIVPSASAGWSGRYDHSSVAMSDGSIILMGGRDKSGRLNDVWQSTDNGVTWTQQTASAEWSGREGHASVAMPDGSIILMGGRDKSGRLNDVWQSTDNGVTWTQQTASAEWSGRERHASVAMPDGSIILMGGCDNSGGSYTASGRLNDIWRSTDKGVTWSQQTANARWSGRFDHSSVAMSDGSIILMGGYGDKSGNSVGVLNDVWWSPDSGVTWSQQTVNAGWSKVRASVAMPDGSIILMGDHLNDVWRSTGKGVTWTQQTASAEWSRRDGHASVAMPDGSIILMGGYDLGYNGYMNDVWRSTDNGVTWTEQKVVPIATVQALSRSTDNGVTWTEQKVVPITTVQALSKSTDNGVTWTEENQDPGLFLPIFLILVVGLLIGAYYTMNRRSRVDRTSPEHEPEEDPNTMLFISPDFEINPEHVKRRQEEASTHLKVAKDLTSAGNYGQAIGFIDKALAINPENTEYQQLRAQLVKQEEARIKRERTLREKQEKKRQEAESLISKAKGLASRGRYLDAIKAVDQALAILPDTREYRDLRAQLVKNDPIPDLSITPQTASLRAGRWEVLAATLTNSGNGDALGIGITLLGDFDTRRIGTYSVNAGASEAIEITLRPRHDGHVPLHITLAYKDSQGRKYVTAREFWIDVGDPAAEFNPQPLTPGLFPLELLTRYTPLEFIGEGGFARVFKVKRKSDDLVVAVKIPRIDEETSSLFIREVAGWYHLTHPNIVRLNGSDLLPIPHVEMEYVDGITIHGKTSRDLDALEKPIPNDQATAIAYDISRGLAYAHEKGIYHHDLKPLNVLITSAKVPKIADFGLSKISSRSSISTSEGYSPLYAAPEQLDPDQYGTPDQRTDLYHLGLLFFELLTGRLPYDGTSQVVIIRKILSPSIAPSTLASMNSGLAIYDPIIGKLIAKRKEERFQHVGEFQDALQDLESLNKQRKELLEDLKATKTSLKLSTRTVEIQRLTRENIRMSVQIALLHARLNDRVSLVTALQEIRLLTAHHAGELDAAIDRVRYMIEEDLPLGDDWIDQLRLLLGEIEMQVRRGQ